MIRRPIRRQSAIAQIAAALLVLLVLAASSVVVMAQREGERVERRTGLIASEQSQTDLNVALGDDVWDGEQFPVFWMQPAGKGEPVMPPGVGRTSEPDQVVVSPELDRLASRHPVLAARYPHRVVLGAEGLQSEDELLAYIRVPEDRRLPGDLVGDLASGGTEALRVRAFGPPSESDDVISIVEPFSGPLPVDASVQGALLFLALPGLVVLVVGVAPVARSYAANHFARLRSRRRSSPLRVPIFAASRTVLSVAPGTVLVAVSWAAASPRLEWVPMVGHDVLRGDLGLAWWLVVAGWIACLIAVGLVALVAGAATAIRRPGENHEPRPERRSIVFNVVSVVPLVVSLWALQLGKSVSWNPEATLNAGRILWLGGVVAAVVGVFLIAPGVLGALGRDLGRLRWASARAASSHLQRDPVREAKPFLMIAALAVVALSVVGYNAATGFEQSTFPSSESEPVFLEWLDPRPGDLERFASAFGTGITVPLREDGHAHGEGHDNAHEHSDVQEGTLVLGATCRQLIPHVPGAPCPSGSAFELPSSTKRTLSEMLVPARHGAGDDVRLASRSEVTDSGSAFVMDDARLQDTETRVRTAAMKTLPAPHVTSRLANTTGPSHLASWTAGGSLAALVILTIACVLSLPNCLLGIISRRSPAAVVSRRRLAAVEAWRFGATFYTIVAVGFVVGISVCATTVLPNTRIPWDAVAFIFGMVVCLGLFGTASAALVGATHTRDEGEGPA